MPRHDELKDLLRVRLPEMRVKLPKPAKGRRFEDRIVKEFFR